MKNIILISLFILIGIGFFGIGGFSYFNKRLTESQKQKETGSIITEIGNSLSGQESASKMSAVETGLQFQNISPSDQSTVTSPYITLRGKTVAQGEVFVNDRETVADAQGNFSVQLTLDEGENPIMIVANDASGNVGEIEITLTYEVAE